MPKKNSPNKRLVLLDAHAILHRAYHALPDFASTKGEPTGALYGLSTMLIGIIKELKPHHIAACYDRPEKTYRHEAYDAYKAGRKKAEDDLVAQMIRSRDIFTAFNIPIYEMPGFEADDMLGTIVEKLKKDKATDIVIASGDMDTLQLVDDRKVQVYTLKKGIKDTVMYDEDAVRTRFGFGPELLPDYKGLRGDPSDNIIGIKGIGEKTATILIQEFGTIEDMYKALKKDKERFVKAGITERIIGLLEAGEEEAKFSKMLATIRRDAPIEFSLPEKEWKAGLEIDKVLNLFTELEFRGLGARVKDAFALEQGSLIPKEQLVLRSPDQAVAPAIPEKQLKETAIALWVLDSNIGNPGIEDILQFGRTNDFDRAREMILGEIEKRNLSKVYKEIELPLIPIVEKMEKRGIKIDRAYLKELSKKYHAELDRLQKKIWESAGEQFNVSSPKQLGVILFEKLGLTAKGLKKTAGGALSTRESELEKLRELHPMIGQILEYRELQKLLGTYIDTIPEMLDKNDRLHTTFLQAGTTTGRMSSNNPNLQNIPIKTELGRNIRNAFVAEAGYKLVSIDYSQIELRIAAFLSEDPQFVDIFKRGEDVHTAVAARVFKVPLDKVDKEMRRRAKVINFGILYGMGINALKQNLGTDRKDAQKFHDEYFNTFNVLAQYMEMQKSIAERTGYTETFFGRRRYFEGIKSKIPYIKAAAERMAINHPIQGTEADLVKLAMIRIEEFVKEEKLEDKVHILLQVHDELVYEVEEKSVSKIVPKLKEIMEGILTMEDTKGVPIIAEAAAGRSWGEMEEA
jgi:DNA polymerase I